MPDEELDHETDEFARSLPNRPVRTERLYPGNWEHDLERLSPVLSFYPSPESYTEYSSAVMASFETGVISLLVWDSESFDWSIFARDPEPDDPVEDQEHLYLAAERLLDRRENYPERDIERVREMIS